MDSNRQHKVHVKSSTYKQLAKQIYADKSVYNKHPLALNQAVWKDDSMHMVVVANSGTHIGEVDEKMFKNKKGIGVLRSGKTCHVISKKAVKDNQKQAYMIYQARAKGLQ